MAARTANANRNGRTAVILAGVVVAMAGLSFASVPLYRLFCQVTGYGGTPQVADVAPAAILERVITVQFNADVDPSLPWRFRPAQRRVKVRVGEPGVARYYARNLAKRAITGQATFNVTPLKAGPYFTKIQCFCFDEQTLAAGQEVEMGVTFFVDPSI
ncbi:MAG: cytochrome c oxidase assembly protein, partial [Kiloniellaceae bacterium]